MRDSRFLLPELSDAPRLRIIAAHCFERDVRLRLPFRFGAATLEAAPQAFVRVRVRLADGREAEGAAAEMMIPKWFDKSPAKSAEDNVDDLRDALRDARDAYVSDSRGQRRSGTAPPTTRCCRSAGRRPAAPRWQRALAARSSTERSSTDCAARWKFPSPLPFAATRPASTTRSRLTCAASASRNSLPLA